MAKKHSSDRKPYSPVDAAFMRSLPTVLVLPRLNNKRMKGRRDSARDHDGCFPFDADGAASAAFQRGLVVGSGPSEVAILRG